MSINRPYFILDSWYGEDSGWLHNWIAGCGGWRGANIMKEHYELSYR
jgi:hypothetical protein